MAVADGVLAEDVAPLAAQVALVHAAGDVVPGEGGEGVPLLVREPVAVDAGSGEGVVPELRAEVLAPGVEGGAVAPGVLDGLGDAAVATAEDDLDAAVGGVVPAEVDAGGAAAVLEQAVLGGELLGGLLAGPLEGRVGLGHVVAGADAHTGAVAGVLAADLLHPAAKVDDALDVFERLGWEADHEVHLDAGPAAGKRIRGGAEEVVLADELVDGVTEALAAGLGGEREGVLLALGDGVGDIDGEAIDAGAGEGDLEVGEGGREGLDHGHDAAVVGRAEGEQRKLLVAGVGEELPGSVDDLLGAALARGAVDHPGLAEAAALRTAALDLDGGAVVNRLEEGHDGLHKSRRKRLDNAALDDGRGSRVGGLEGGEMAELVVARFVEGGDVDAGHGEQVAQAGGAGGAFALPGADKLGNLDDGVFALPEDKGVDEGGEGLGVEGAAAAGDNDGVVLAAVAGAWGNTREVEHVEDVGVGQLVLEGEAEDVEIAQGVAGLEAPEGNAIAAHLRFHVGPGGEGAFADNVVVGVEEVVEDAETHVRHADVVGIGVGQGDAHGGSVPVLRD